MAPQNRCGRKAIPPLRLHGARRNHGSHDPKHSTRSSNECVCGSCVHTYAANANFTAGSRSQTCRVGKEADRKAGCSRDWNHRGFATNHAVAGFTTGARTGTPKETDRFLGGRTTCALQILKRIQKAEKAMSVSREPRQEWNSWDQLMQENPQVNLRLPLHGPAGCQFVAFLV